jgi:large subunit ribosomal protein L10
MMQSLFTLGLVTSAAAFTGPTSIPRTGTAVFGGAAGMATTREGKTETVNKVKALLDSSEMIFSVPASGVAVSEVQTLRRSLPEGTTMSVVKNTLMKKAIEGTDYETAAEGIKGANMWFFIEEDIGATVKAFNSFVKEEDMQDMTILAGILEGTVYDAAGVVAISKLPSKKELLATIAARIQALPTKVARVIKAPGIQVARAIKLAGEVESDDN